ncbi:hypothetical protein [Microbacterium sp. NPDC055599]
MTHPSDNTPTATDDEREALKNAIGYDPVPLSIRDHPEIRFEYRTTADRDGLIERILAAVFRRSEVPEPSAERGADALCGDWPAPCNCDEPETHDGSIPRWLVQEERHPEPQGEASDAQIEAAARAIHSVAESGASWQDARMADKEQHRAEARAALCAAFAVAEQGENR